VSSVRKYLGIRDLPKVKRPREKLNIFGISNLTDEEILAIILGSGTKKSNVLKLARKILKKYPLKILVNVGLSNLTSIDGIGIIQAGKIVASLELGKRAARTKTFQRILKPKDVVEASGEIVNKSQEHMVCLYLNARHELISKKTVAIGTLNQNLIEPRDIFSEAITTPCAFIILVHNHPSGEVKPSKDDINFTKMIVRAGNLLGIEVIDQLIVTEKDFFSFREGKLM